MGFLWFITGFFLQNSQRCSLSRFFVEKPFPCSRFKGRSRVEAFWCFFRVFSCLLFLKETSVVQKTKLPPWEKCFRKGPERDSVLAQIYLPLHWRLYFGLKGAVWICFSCLVTFAVDFFVNLGLITETKGSLDVWKKSSRFVISSKWSWVITSNPGIEGHWLRSVGFFIGGFGGPVVGRVCL